MLQWTWSSHDVRWDHWFNAKKGSFVTDETITFKHKMKPWGTETRDSVRVKSWLEWENAFRTVR